MRSIDISDDFIAYSNKLDKIIKLRAKHDRLHRKLNRLVIKIYIIEQSL